MGRICFVAVPGEHDGRRARHTHLDWHMQPRQGTVTGRAVALGPLIGAPQCRLLILRNGNDPCRYFFNFPIDLEIVQCRLSILRKHNVPCRYFSNVPVHFKVAQCRLLNLRKRRVTLSISRVKSRGMGGQRCGNRGFGRGGGWCQYSGSMGWRGGEEGE